MVPFRHNSPPSTREKKLVQHWHKHWHRLTAQRWQTGCAGGTQHPASNARQIPSQLGLRQEGRIFPPVLPLSWSFLPVLWGLQCSNKLDKGPMGTISSEDMHSTELYSETRWVYWAEPLKENFNYIVRNFSPHGCPHQLHGKTNQGRALGRQSAGSLHPWSLPHTVTINKHSYSWEPPANMSALKNPHKCTWTWRASGWHCTVKGTLK